MIEFHPNFLISIVCFFPPHTPVDSFFGLAGGIGGSGGGCLKLWLAMAASIL